MINFELEVGGSINIFSMDSEEAGKIEMTRVLRFLKQDLKTSTGLHGCDTIQTVKGKGDICIPNDMRHALNIRNVGFKERKMKGFTETEVQPIPADEVR